MNRQTLNRYTIYSAGLVLLAAGITLNTKTELGVSPLISIPFSISEIWNLSFPIMTFLLYSFFVVLQFILKGCSRQAKDILQIPLSLAFSILLDIFSSGYDSMTAYIGFQADTYLLKGVILLLAVITTGVGAAMMIAMDLIPNPADGLADTIGKVFGRNLGFGKNFMDISSVAVTFAIDIIFSGKLTGIGIGTIVSMIGVGRCIAAFNHFFRESMLSCAGRLKAPEKLSDSIC